MANQTLVRHINERRLLGVLRLSGPLSRAELARRLSLTRAAVTSMVDDLLLRKMVRELVAEPAGSEARRDPGRPGIDIAIEPGGAHFLGAEIGVGVLRFALLDLTGSVVETETVYLEDQSRPAAVVALIAAKLTSLRQQPAWRDSIRALGVTVPGLVRSDGYVINLPILGWKDVNLSHLIDAAIDLPCHVENNANAAAFGHLYADQRRAEGVVVYLKIGNGCGGAVIVDGKLMRGGEGMGAEFGHIRIADTGPLCSCGQRGCLETFVNLKALRRYLGGSAAIRRTSDLDLPILVADRLGKADPAAIKALDELAAHLARGLVTITNIFNAEEVVFGGVMLPLLDAVLDRIAKPLARQIVPGMPLPQLTISRIGPFECAIGAAALAHHEEFDLANLDLRA